MTIIAGLDLAWTPHNPSGICLLRAEAGVITLLDLSDRVVVPGPLACSLRAMEANVIAAVDAPLLRRDGCMAERELGRVFGRFHASAYLASVTFLTKQKMLQGPRLGRALTSHGFSLNPASVVPGATGHNAFEMYPHAFHVVAFELTRRIAYKKGRLAVRREGLALYQRYLGALIDREAPGLLADARIAAVLEASVIPVAGRAAKGLEDRLDALSCAMAGLAAWRHGIAPSEVFGGWEEGSIAVPGIARDARFATTTAPTPLGYTRAATRWR